MKAKASEANSRENQKEDDKTRVWAVTADTSPPHSTRMRPCKTRTRNLRSRPSSPPGTPRSRRGGRKKRRKKSNPPSCRSRLWSSARVLCRQMGGCFKSFSLGRGGSGWEVGESSKQTRKPKSSLYQRTKNCTEEFGRQNPFCATRIPPSVQLPPSTQGTHTPSRLYRPVAHTQSAFAVAVVVSTTVENSGHREQGAFPCVLLNAPVLHT